MSSTIRLTDNFKVSEDANKDFNDQLKSLIFQHDNLPEWEALFSLNFMEIPRSQGGFGHSEIIAWERDMPTSYELVLRALNCSKAFSKNNFINFDAYLRFLELEEPIIIKFNQDYAELQRLVVEAHQRHNAVKQNQQQGNTTNLKVKKGGKGS